MAFRAAAIGTATLRMFPLARSAFPASLTRMISVSQEVASFAPPTRPAQMPWSMRSTAGFAVPVNLGPSNIPGGGFGRFAVMPVGSGAVVRADAIVDAEDFVGAGGVREGHTVAIRIQDSADMKALVAHFSASGPEARVREMLSWFIAGVPAERAEGRPLTYMLAHSFHTNHGDDHNMETVVQDGLLLHKATRDIEAGEELLLNYKHMGIPGHVKEWFAEHGLQDVQTLAEGLPSLE